MQETHFALEQPLLVPHQILSRSYTFMLQRMLRNWLSQEINSTD